MNLFKKEDCKFLNELESFSFGETFDVSDFLVQIDCVYKKNNFFFHWKNGSATLSWGENNAREVSCDFSESWEAPTSGEFENLFLLLISESIVYDVECVVDGFRNDRMSQFK